MDSKPLAIILAIVITFGAMGVIVVYGGNVLSGTSTNTELLPKTLEVLSVDEDYLRANILFTNQGSNTIRSIDAVLEVENLYNYTLSANGDIEPHKTVVITGNIQDGVKPNFVNLNGDPFEDDNWSIFPGDKVLLRVSATTTSGDYIEKIYTIIVQ